MSKDKPKLEAVKRQFTPQELLDIWSSENDLEVVMCVGIAKNGSYKFALSGPQNFETLGILESIVQKWKLDSIKFS